jgi:transcriptional regulator with XRE-family HTH domain
MPKRRETDNTSSGVVGRNVARLRKVRGMTTRAVSERITELGVPLYPSGISDIEMGRRVVTVDQLTALAAALSVAPITLLLPAEEREPHTPFALTGTGEAPAELILAWLRGYVPLDADQRADDFEVEAFHRRSLPRWGW